MLRSLVGSEMCIRDRCYRSELTAWDRDARNKKKSLNRAVFCQLWTKVYTTWTAPSKVWNGARKCGFGPDGLDPSQMGWIPSRWCEGGRVTFLFCGSQGAPGVRWMELFRSTGPFQYSPAHLNSPISMASSAPELWFSRGNGQQGRPTDRSSPGRAMADQFLPPRTLR
eukprot:TRINITY_DN6698_c0_g1_i4.p1 TRINITY_DN6698_c0_g1~~TRINITY_DN6698_c0_g1_i4.p1  ORF type:complete len:168 (-),score=19.34 TRINITY_DN6698_c0_g1_i4:178-681(-)